VNTVRKLVCTSLAVGFFIPIIFVIATLGHGPLNLAIALIAAVCIGVGTCQILRYMEELRLGYDLEGDDEEAAQ
jgi:hypothetical protein